MTVAENISYFVEYDYWKKSWDKYLIQEMYDSAVKEHMDYESNILESIILYEDGVDVSNNGYHYHALECFICAKNILISKEYSANRLYVLIDDRINFTYKCIFDLFVDKFYELDSESFVLLDDILNAFTLYSGCDINTFKEYLNSVFEFKDDKALGIKERLNNE